MAVPNIAIAKSYARLVRAGRKTLDEVLATTSHDSYFEAAQAVEFGLADRVITTL